MSMEKFVKDKREETQKVLDTKYHPIHAEELLRLRSAFGDDGEISAYLIGILDCLDWFERVQKDIVVGGLK